MSEDNTVQTTSPAEVIEFWAAAGRGAWFGGGDTFDAQCRQHFHDLHHAAGRRELERWLDNAEGALALLILLDQIPRNIFRGSGHAFATDSLALHYASCAIEAGFDRQVASGLRLFFYLPFEHSEQLADQHRSVALVQGIGDADYDRYAQAHLDVIARFGRFPHRNRALGRLNTPQEQVWLDAGGGF